MTRKIRFGATALLAAALSLGATAALADKKPMPLGHHFLAEQGLLKHNQAASSPTGASKQIRMHQQSDLEVWGQQIHRRGWDGSKNFPVEQPKRALDVHKVPAASAFRGFTATERRAVQERLRAYGFYAGGIDGKWGPLTWAAVQRYAHEAGVFGELRDRRGAYGVFQGIMH